MSVLELCEKYFNTRDIYKLLEIPKDALEKDIKKAYYKLSLQVHPDRITDNAEKPLATEKFKVLSKIYQVLTDKDKRAIYDEQGIIDDDEFENLESKLNSWLELWRKIFKPLSIEEIENYEKDYIGSELERIDIKKAYLAGKGCINYLMNGVPFLRIEDEPRLQKIVREMIDADEVPEYKIFTKEPAQKRKRRHQKYARESKEAAEIYETKKAQRNEQNADDAAGSSGTSASSSLTQQLMERRQAREQNFDNLMDKLIEKYGDEDDSDAIDWYSVNKKSNKKKKKSTVGAGAGTGAAGATATTATAAVKEKETAAKNKESNIDKKMKTVKNGKVKKRPT